MNNFKKTKIICTIGPASESPAVLEKMARAGMNACRLNFSHGEYAWHENALKNIRAVSKKTGIGLIAVQDLCGPKIRVGELEKPSIKLKEGGEIILTSRTIIGNEKKISVSYPRLAKDVKKGDVI
ncbi:MAG: pyruvate kinase, partial [Patescibacteria group bacterium]